jgi:hypothetical protein
VIAGAHSLYASPGRLYRLHQDGSMDAPIEFEPPDPSQETVMQAQDYAIASRSAREAWLVASTYYRLYLWEIIDGKASGGCAPS